jgi:hypothetical protein
MDKENHGKGAEGETIIVGGGISGLLAANELIKRGVKDIRILESEDRIGGKARSAFVGGTAENGGQLANMGPEFIDKDHKKIQKLATELGITLIPASEQTKELFQSVSGKMMPDFLEKFAPIARRMASLRDEMDRNPAFEAQMKNISATELMRQLGASVPAVENPTLLQRIYNAVTFSSNTVPKEVLDTALSVGEKETGTSAATLSAYQFLWDFSPSTDRFLSSTCDYRVDPKQGGTEGLVIALKKKLEADGVKFETGYKLDSLRKEGDENVMGFVTPQGEKTLQSKNIVLALPDYAARRIKGIKDIKDLECLGQEESVAPYTKNAKLTVKLKPGVKLPSGNANAFLTGSECWSAEPGVLTFLCHNENNEKPLVVMTKALQNYASAFGKAPEELFYIEGGKPAAGSFAYTDPKGDPCWANEKIGRSKEMDTAYAQMAASADHGIGFVSTHLPLEDGSMGFMECSANAAEMVAQRLASRMHEKHHDSHSHQHEHEHSFAAAVTAEREAASKGLAI